jgi:hypothetical protein
MYFIDVHVLVVVMMSLLHCSEKSGYDTDIETGANSSHVNNPFI